MYTIDVVRFWSKVERLGPDECWPWRASLSTYGYGQFWVNELHRNEPASRVSWVLHRGTIPATHEVCHTCDNPACVNPAHLYLGTVQQNALDKVARGRWRGGRPAPLPESQIADMILGHQLGLTYEHLGEMYGIKAHSVKGLIRRRERAR